MASAGVKSGGSEDQVAWVGKDRRVVIDRALVEPALGIRLAPGKTLQLWAITGVSKQIQLLPPESELAKLRDLYEENMARRQLAWNASMDSVSVHARLAGFFRIPCRARRHSRSFRLSLPVEIIDLDLLRINEPLVLLAVGSVVQLWRRDRWTEVTGIEDLSEFTREVRDILENEE